MLQNPSVGSIPEPKQLLLSMHHSLMRYFSCILLLLVLLQLSLASRAQTEPGNATITLSGEKITLEQIIKEIKKQTNFDVVINPQQVSLKLKTTVNAKALPLSAFLDHVCGQHSLSYSFIRNLIMIQPRAKTNADVQAEQPGVSGMVRDAKTANPVYAVSVVVKRTGKGTQTDAMGNYKLNDVHDRDTIVFSNIGYKRKMVPAKNRKELEDVLLNIAVDELDQAVVQAYGVTSKRFATGNTVKVSGDEIRRLPVQDPLIALQGKVPGMLVTRTSQYASAPVKLEIRGRNSLNKTLPDEPLLIVDGVVRSVLNTNNPLNQRNGVSSGPVQAGFSLLGGQNPLFGMNMQDIESIEVLMDADATAIYGARGANGVVLITTKKPKPGRASVNASVRYNYNDYIRVPALLGLSDYLKMRREAFRNDNAIPTTETAPDLLLWDTTKETNWQKNHFYHGTGLMASAGISGGAPNATASLNASYSKANPQGSSGGNNETFSLGIASVLNSSDRKLTLTSRADYTSTKTTVVPLPQGLNSAPNAPPMLDSIGRPNFNAWRYGSNPNYSYYPWADVFRPNHIRVNTFSGSIMLNYILARGLSFTNTASYVANYSGTENLTPIISLDPINKPTGSAFFGESKATTVRLNPSLSYSRQLGKGRLEVTTGLDYSSSETKGTNIMATGFTNDALINSVSNASMFGTMVLDNHVMAKSLGAVFQIIYNWNEKYQVKLSGNRDGSSLFGEDKRFGNFGSVGASWIVSEEKWFKRFVPKWIDFFKMFANYGISGGAGIDNYQYLSQWGGFAQGGLATGIKLYDYEGMLPYVPIHPVNQQYHWAATKHLSTKLDMSFWNRRLEMGFSWFRKITDDQLVSQPTPSYTGFPSVVENSPATMMNRGWTFTLGGKIISRKDIEWIASFNIGRTISRVIAFPNIEMSAWAGQVRVGASDNLLYLLHYTGVDPLTGLPTVEDRNGDGMIVTDNALRTGHPLRDDYVEIDRNPSFSGGWSTFLNYKNFTFSVGGSFIKAWVQDPFSYQNPGRLENVFLPPGRFENTWRKPGDQAMYPRFSTMSPPVSISNTDLGWTNALAFTFNGIGMGYSLPENLLKKLSVRSCTVGLTTSNLFLLTNFRGLDPTLGNKPLPRTISASINITL